MGWKLLPRAEKREEAFTQSPMLMAIWRVMLLLGRVLGSQFTAVTADCLVLLVSSFAGLFIGVFGVIAATDCR